jgi:hypothetical protein
MKTRIIYINIKGNYGVETIDEFPYSTRIERIYAREMMQEYNRCMQGAYMSRRCTKDWRTKL